MAVRWVVCVRPRAGKGHAVASRLVARALVSSQTGAAE